MLLTLVSCNQKNEKTTTDSNNMNRDSTMENKDTINKRNHLLMENEAQMYRCPMHPEVQGKLNDKCSKCGMKLTELVPKKTE